MELVVRGNNKGAIKMENNIDISELVSVKNENVIPEWLDFKPTCPVELLRQQEIAMNDYMRILEIRAQMECILLDW